MRLGNELDERAREIFGGLDLRCRKTSDALGLRRFQKLLQLVLRHLSSSAPDCAPQRFLSYKARSGGALVDHAPDGVDRFFLVLPAKIDGPARGIRYHLLLALGRLGRHRHELLYLARAGME